MQRLAGKYKFFILIHAVTQPLALAERPYCYKMLLLVVSKEVLWTRPGWSDPIFIFMTRPTIAASWLAGQEGAACLVGTARRSFLRLDGSDRVSLYSSPPWWPKRTLDAVLASSPSWLVGWSVCLNSGQTGSQPTDQPRVAAVLYQLWDVGVGEKKMFCGGMGWLRLNRGTIPSTSHGNIARKR